MKKKTSQVVSFIEGMHSFITKHPQFRLNTKDKSETQIQAEIRPIIVCYLEDYFKNTVSQLKEKEILVKMWKDFNVFIKFV